jgi:hypothetical protein
MSGLCATAAIRSRFGLSLQSLLYTCLEMDTWSMAILFFQIRSFLVASVGLMRFM